MALASVTQSILIDWNDKNMKTFYQISSQETGIVVLKKRKIAKAYRWWLRENGFAFKCVYLLK